MIFNKWWKWAIAILIWVFCGLAGIFMASCFSYANASVNSFNNCSQLNNSKAVLLVCMPYCPSCADFIPVYRQVSNQKKDWVFYKTTITNSATICGKKIYGFPTILTKYNVHVGYMSVRELNRFLI